jgi:hypothetical protein
MLNGGVASMRFWTASGVRQLAVSSTHIATVRPMAIAAERMTGVRVSVRSGLQIVRAAGRADRHPDGHSRSQR